MLSTVRGSPRTSSETRRDAAFMIPPGPWRAGVHVVTQGDRDDVATRFHKGAVDNGIVVDRQAAVASKRFVHRRSCNKVGHLPRDNVT